MTKGRPPARWAFSVRTGRLEPPAAAPPSRRRRRGRPRLAARLRDPGTRPGHRARRRRRAGRRRPRREAPDRAGHGTFLCVERAAGPFERLVELPEEPDPDGGSASYADGLLTLEIPRRPATRRRTIPIHPARGGEKK